MDYVLSQLPSGLRVLTVPMMERKSAAVAIWVKVGARYETVQQAGISHLIEHMLFKGTKNRNARQIKLEIEGVGGMLNAYTGDDSTCYFSKLLSKHVPIAIEVFADMISNSQMAPEQLKREKTVIVEEIRMYRDLPSHYVHELMAELLWPGHPLGRSIAGTPKSVSKMTQTQIRSYMKSYYHPSNILIGVSGAVEHAEIVKLVKKYFRSNKKKPQKRDQSFEQAKPKQTKPQFAILDKETEQTHFVIGMPGLSRYHSDRYALGIMNTILGANMSSRLFEEVREKRGLAYEIRSSASFYQDTGALSISAGVENLKAPVAIQVILRELDKFRKTKVKPGELKRAKDYFMSQIHMGVEDTLDHLLWVGERALIKNDLMQIENIQKSVRSVTADDILRVAKRLIKSSKLNLSLVGSMKDSVRQRMIRDFKF